ncbi:MAG: transcription antitermination factor NusB [Rickettsiales bacterium]|jgi:transcription antitermination factor NusB
MNDVAAKKSNPSLQKKTAARIAAVQCLYERLVSEVTLTPTSQLSNLKERLANNTGEQKLTLGLMLEPNYSLVTAILEGTLKWQEDIDKRIDGTLSKEWTRERMSPILIAILQCSIFELFFFKDTAHKILIDEYSRLTSRFFAEAEVNFINGALKNLHSHFHAEK